MSLTRIYSSSIAFDNVDLIDAVFDDESINSRLLDLENPVEANKLNSMYLIIFNLPYLSLCFY